MLVPGFSNATVARSMHSVFNGGFICNGADYQHDNPLTELVFFLRSLVDPNAENEIHSRKDYLSRQTGQISGNIINTKNVASVGYNCRVAFGNNWFTLTASSDSSPITVSNEKTGKTSIENYTFPALQKCMLAQYIKERRQQGYSTIELCGFNLGVIDLSDINFENVSFQNQLLSEMQVDHIIAGGGNLAGARLIIAGVPMEQAFDESGMNKSMALDLIKLGANQQFVFKNYIATEHNLEHPNINIDGFDFNKIDLKEIDLHDVNLGPLYGYNKTIVINTHKFFISMHCGRAQVQAEQTRTAGNLATQEDIRKTLNSSDTRKNKIAQMTHNALPSALQRLTPDHWKKIGNSVLAELSKSKPNLIDVVDRGFYSDIYEKASLHIGYKFKDLSENSRTEQWRTTINSIRQDPKWRPSEIQYGQCKLQFDKKGPDNIKKTRVFLTYQPSSSSKSRLQFVVSTDAGMELYTDIAKVIDKYIIEKCKGDLKQSPVIQFKVFNEDFQVGRSDSAVIYLSAPLTDLRVKEFVKDLNSAIRDRIAQIDIIGATSINDSYIQGITIPDHDLQKKILGEKTSSHGQLITNILIRAYTETYKDLVKTSEDKLNLSTLNQRAQFYTNAIWHELGL